MLRWFLTILVFCGLSHARADVIVNLQGTSGSSSFFVSFDGTLTAGGAGLTELFFTGFNPFVNAPFVFQPVTGDAQISGSFGSAALGSIAAPSSSILRVDVSPDKFVTGGETLTLSGSGTFTLPGLTFDDFTTGTYSGISDGFLQPTGDATLIISSAPASAVPEPSALALILCGLACVSARRWRARRRGLSMYASSER